MTKSYYYCQECQNTVAFNHECVIEVAPIDTRNAWFTQTKLTTLTAEVEASEVVYAMDYEDDARLTRLERKVDALIKYLLENNS
jgi:arsenate reductase-like glutaredoxin family protein